MKATVLNYENYSEIENALVIGDFQDEAVKVGNKVKDYTFVSDDEQDSFKFIEFDNNTVIFGNGENYQVWNGHSVIDELENLFDEFINLGEVEKETMRYSNVLVSEVYEQASCFFNIITENESVKLFKNEN